jgi:hypothetical protein
MFTAIAPVSNTKVRSVNLTVNGVIVRSDPLLFSGSRKYCGALVKIALTCCRRPRAAAGAPASQRYRFNKIRLKFSINFLK